MKIVPLLIEKNETRPLHASRRSLRILLLIRSPPDETRRGSILANLLLQIQSKDRSKIFENSGDNARRRKQRHYSAVSSLRSIGRVSSGKSSTVRCVRRNLDLPRKRMFLIPRFSFVIATCPLFQSREGNHDWTVAATLRTTLALRRNRNPDGVRLE